MKTILVATVAALLVGCDSRIEVSPDFSKSKAVVENISTVKYRTLIGPNVYLVEIEGHKYLTLLSGSAGGIVHAESCSCKTR